MTAAVSEEVRVDAIGFDVRFNFRNIAGPITAAAISSALKGVENMLRLAWWTSDLASLRVVSASARPEPLLDDVLWEITGFRTRARVAHQESERPWSRTAYPLVPITHLRMGSLEVLADATAFFGALGALAFLLERYANLPLKIKVERLQLRKQMREFETDLNAADEKVLHTLTSAVVNPPPTRNLVSAPKPSEASVVGLRSREDD